MFSVQRSISASSSLIRNAANFFGGFFEELSPEQVQTQIATNLFGPLTVTRAVLPVMRRQRAGRVITISSIAGLVGQQFCSAYAASKFGLEGGMESLTPEVEPFGIHTTIVEPGFFRTELLEPASTTYAQLSIADYAARTTDTVAAWQGMNGQQAGDPAKLATALVELAATTDPPARWVAGADAVAAAEQKARTPARAGRRTSRAPDEPGARGHPRHRLREGRHHEDHPPRSRHHQGPRRLVHRRRLHRHGRRPRGALASGRRHRALHARRPHRLAHAPARAKASAPASAKAARSTSSAPATPGSSNPAEPLARRRPQPLHGPRRRGHSP